MAQPDRLSLAVNHALNDARLARARMGLLGPSGVGLDSKREAAWCEYGFKESLSFHDFYKLYKRGGLAYGAVTKLAGTCWQSNPWVIEGDELDESERETGWERKAASVLTARLWRHFKEADVRRLVGRHSGLILRMRDSGRWDQPVRKGSALVEVIPVWAGSLEVAEWNTDLSSENYGKPKFWHYIETAANGQPGRQIKTHPDRIFILGDYSADATGFLEPAYNNFVSLEKVEGGSGESFLKNAARQLNINFDAQGIDFNSLASMYGVTVQDLQAKFDEVAVEMNRGNDTVLVTQGATTTPLVTTVPDPQPTYNINLQTISAALDIPSRVLVGNQQGERASTEDLKYFRARCQSRRQDLAFEVEDFVDHLVRIGVLPPTGEKTVMWDDLNEQTSGEKLDNALKMAQINQAAIATGEAVFATDEVRTAAGHDPADIGPLGEDDEDEDGDETETSNPAP